MERRPRRVPHAAAGVERGGRVGRVAESPYRRAGAARRRPCVTLYELGLVLASALLHAWWSVAIKDSRDPLAFNLLQLVAPVRPAAADRALRDAGPRSHARVWWLLAGTGLWHGLYFYWMSRAFEHGDLTLVYPIARSTPAFLPLISVPLLGERSRPARPAASRSWWRGSGWSAPARGSRARPSRRRPRASPSSRSPPESATRSSTSCR